MWKLSFVVVAVFALLLGGVAQAGRDITSRGAHGAKITFLTQSDQTIEFYQDIHALVVGVENYDQWPLRANAVRDARDVSWALKRLGFSVRLLTDPTMQDLRSALNEFGQNPGNQVERGLIFYFVGNSLTPGSDDGAKISWIIPKDAPLPEKNRQGFEEKAISTDEIVSIVGLIQSRHVLCLIDAPLAADAFQVEPAVLKIVSKSSASPTRQFITLGDAHVPVSENSPFKRFLLKGLSGEADLIKDGVVSGTELGLYLSDRVGKVTHGQLQPQYGRLSVIGEQHGDFIIQLNDRIPQIARLFVNPQPEAAATRILNIKPKFEQGMELEPGQYRLHVSAQGYDTVEKSIDLKAGEDRTEQIRLSKAQSELTNSLGMRFIRIRPGTFMMGSSSDEPGRSNDETRHRVKLTRRFYIQSTEVTVAQFKQFVQSTGYKTESEKGGGCWITGSAQGWTQKPDASWKKPGLLKIDNALPVLCVTWNDASAFAKWLSRKERLTYRLPTESEWEYACRAGITTPFSSGGCLSTDAANYGKPGYPYQQCKSDFRKNHGRPTKVGRSAPNPWKLHNMHGNVSEWCQDWYGPYPSENAVNPEGPQAGSERVMRGGHWQADAAGCRSAKRRRFPPNLASDVVGFRLVMVP